MPSLRWTPVVTVVLSRLRIYCTVIPQYCTCNQRGRVLATDLSFRQTLGQASANCTAAMDSSFHPLSSVGTTLLLLLSPLLLPPPSCNPRVSFLPELQIQARVSVTSPPPAPPSLCRVSPHHRELAVPAHRSWSDAEAAWGGSQMCASFASSCSSVRRSNAAWCRMLARVSAESEKDRTVQGCSCGRDQR